MSYLLNSPSVSMCTCVCMWHVACAMHVQHTAYADVGNAMAMQTADGSDRGRRGDPGIKLSPVSCPC
eukprot:2117632-Prymnesium_polylepis.2